MQNMEQSSCTEDRIQHALERCLCDLGQDTPDKCLWNGRSQHHNFSDFFPPDFHEKTGPHLTAEICMVQMIC